MWWMGSNILMCIFASNYSDLTSLQTLSSLWSLVSASLPAFCFFVGFCLGGFPVFFAWLVKEFLSDYELLILFVFCFNKCSTVFELPLVYVNNRTSIYNSDLALSILSFLGLDSWVLMSPRVRNIATYNCFLLVFHFFSHYIFTWKILLESYEYVVEKPPWDSKSSSEFGQKVSCGNDPVFQVELDSRLESLNCVCLRGTLNYQYILRTVRKYCTFIVLVLFNASKHQVQSRELSDCICWNSVNLMLQKEYK